MCQGVINTQESEDLVLKLAISLIINKIDIAPYVGADLEIMKKDARILRGAKPTIFVNSKTGEGIAEVASHVIKDVLFGAPPKTSK